MIPPQKHKESFLLYKSDLLLRFSGWSEATDKESFICKNPRIAQEREEGIRQQNFAEGCSADFVLLIWILKRSKGRVESLKMSKDV